MQQFIYVWGTKDQGNNYSSPYFSCCTEMVGWIVCCLSNKMTSIFSLAVKLCVTYYRLVMGFFPLNAQGGSIDVFISIDDFISLFYSC